MKDIVQSIERIIAEKCLQAQCLFVESIGDPEIPFDIDPAIPDQVPLERLKCFSISDHLPIFLFIGDTWLNTLYTIR